MARTAGSKGPSKASSKAPGQAARQAASSMLASVMTAHKMLSDLAEAPEMADLRPPERARAQTLAAGVLRNLEPIDMVLVQFMARQPPDNVLNILRIAVFELLVDNIPPHAAVDAAVRQIRANRKLGGFAGMTNAVARKVASEGPEIWRDLSPTPLPEWISAVIGDQSQVAAIEKVLSQTPPTDLTLRNQNEAGELKSKLEAEELPSGTLRLRKPGQISRLPGFAEGQWWVQDAAAALPVRLLGDIAGVKTLDLCAAPGGKTLQLAAAGAKVTAIDNSKKRMRRVTENLERTGLPAKLISADLTRWDAQEKADLIVLDAPCSASGTLRRHPDLPHVRPDPKLAPLLKLQALLLDRALSWLSPKGRLLYVTCSLLPSEGEDQVKAACDRVPGLKVLPPENPPALPEGALTSQGWLRTRPDMWADAGGMDGFFAAILGFDR